MGKGIRWLIVIMVIVLVVVAYMAMVGFSVAEDDFSDPIDTNIPGEPTEGTIAYATFYTKVTMWLYPPTSEFYEIRGYVMTIAPDVNLYISPDEGQVFHQDTWDILSPVPPSPVVGDVWVVIDISGPDGYSSSWASDKVGVHSINTVPTFAEWDSGRAFFESTGTYQAKVTMYGTLYDSGWEDEVISDKVVNFEVDV